MFRAGYAWCVFDLLLLQEGSAGPGCVLRAQLFEAQTGGDWNGPSHSFSIAGYHDFLLQVGPAGLQILSVFK